MEIAHTRGELKDFLKGLESSGIGFVPTMGALHAGHISLVEKARKENSTVVVSIFVNPTQFNDREDLKRYPRTPETDLEMLEKAGADLVFVPQEDEIYPEPDTRVFDFGKLDKVMEGATRPGHFNGVAQVVSRLFDLVRPGKTYFGDKDFQQIAVIRALTEMLEMPVEIIACPIVREADGLAMSSRNTLLTPEHRAAAPEIYKAIKEGAEMMGSATPREIEKFVTEKINSNPLLETIYFKIVNGRTLQEINDWSEGEHRDGNGKKDGIQGCVAVKAGNIRLIDNVCFI